MTDLTESASRRRRRLSDAETARRMLDAAGEMIRSAGLTVSLEHISLEDVIRKADVSRTAAYRRWKYKDDFFADLLRELARDPHPEIAGTLARYRELTDWVLDHLDELDSEHGRARLHAGFMRIGAGIDLALLAGSHRWSSYIALQAAVLSLDEGEFRTELRALLAASEAQIHERLAANYEAIAGLLGLRLLPDVDVTFSDLAVLCSSLLNGVAIKAQVDDSLVDRRMGGGAGDGEDWSLPAAGCYAIQRHYLQPDPAVVWDADRIAAVRAIAHRAAELVASGDAALLADPYAFARLLGSGPSPR